MGHPSIWGSPARESQLQGGNTELQGLLKMLLQKSSVNSHPPVNMSAAMPVSSTHLVQTVICGFSEADNSSACIVAM